MHYPTRVALGLSLLLAASAWAAPKNLVVAHVRGDSSGAVRNQLVRALCGPLPCVPLAQVSTRAGGIDAGKLARSQALLLTGRETSTRRSRSVTLSLEDRPGHVIGRYVFSLGKKGLSDEAIGTVRREIEKQLGVAAPAPKPLQAKPVPQVPGPKPKPTPPAAAPPATATTGGARTAPRPQGTAGARGSSSAAPAPATAVMGPEEAAKKRALTPLPLVAVEAGLSGLDISLDWENLTSQNLRAYDANFALVPRFRVETYPGVRFTRDWERGLGAEFEYQQAVGLNSSVEGGESHPTTYRAYDFLVKYRWEPFRFPLRVEPLLGWRLSTFRVEPVNGTFITGLPELEYNGPELGIAADYPVDRFLVLARARFLPLLSSGEVLSTDYFNSGSLWGVDLEAGAGYRILDHFSARLVFEYLRYHFTFRTLPGDQFVASGATSQYAGGRVMLRYEFD